uniref:Uncharacterized protein n=1 Tax=Tanacetum cinerariifolium TaxID=118510 RepID=A0A699QCK0_TANCI|nr:hypothetical protein [Tanacetum cinerariifolium]
MVSNLPSQTPVSPESAALLAQIENHCTVECFSNEPRYFAWIRAAVDAAADLWALRQGWAPEMVRATYKRNACLCSSTPISWNATTGILSEY